MSNMGPYGNDYGTTDRQTDRLIPENCALLRYHTASSVNFLPMLRYNPAVPSSRKDSSPPKMRLSCPETSKRNYHYSLRNNPEESSFHLLRAGCLKSRTGLFLQ